MDRRSSYALEAAAAALPDGKRYLDRAGPAIYQTEPVLASVILCFHCRYVMLVPSVPRSIRFVHPCSSCGSLIPLEPPFEVLGAADSLRSAIERAVPSAH